MLTSRQISTKPGRLSRALKAIAVGIAVTLGLLYLMQVLIEMGDGVYTDTPDFDLQFGLPPPTPVPDDSGEPPPERLPDPERTPGFTYSQDIPSEPVTPIVLEPQTPSASGGIDLQFNASTDGPLVMMLKVKPPYPIPALTQGIEGYVIVQYDVLQTGAVGNVVIIESSNEIFDAAAVEALSKFRYKPRMIDGVNLETKGMKRMFQFEIRNKRAATPE